MYYIISTKNRDLKWIRVMKNKQQAEKLLHTQENDFRDRELFTNKKECARAMNKYCDNFSCRTISSCMLLIDTEIAIKRPYDFIIKED